VDNPRIRIIPISILDRTQTTKDNQENIYGASGWFASIINMFMNHPIERADAMKTAQALLEQKSVYLDTETTGLEHSDEIVELGTTRCPV
jgi:uncharacterized protein YprB with RNaseH-like and TPR domain